MLKIQFLNGGLANQAFQYIFARHYELSHPGKIMYMDDSYFALNTVHNGYELDKVFGIKAHMLSEMFDDDVWQYMLEQNKNGKSIPQIFIDNGEDMLMMAEVAFWQFNPFYGRVSAPKKAGYCPDIQDIEENIYYHGYWIDKDWFMKYENILRKEFTFPPLSDYKNQKLMDNILKEKSLAIHIRRGDYVTHGFAFDATEYAAYIDMFMNTTSGNWIPYIFSDDIDWCKQNAEELGLNKFRKVVYVEGNTKGNNYIDLQLMSNCSGMILSNSAFCYLAAILDTNLKYCLNPTNNNRNF
jgi:hypothetical protein